ncbi:MAG TPA: hypothetical protein PLV42_05995 [bacterium]|nr:hypothetical protein [bacterium]
MAGLLILLSVTLLFGDALFLSSGLVLTSGTTDVFLTFYHQRSFAVAEILAGNLPHWNPYIFSGSVFSSDSEPALFYPFYLVYLVFPIHQAINLDISFHMTLLGFFTYLWVSRNQCGLLPSLLASFFMMFGGAYYMHFYSGHLGVLATSAWAPLILLSLDKMRGGFRKARGWLFAGFFAAAMSFLAGQLQYVIISAVAAGTYSVYLAFTGEGKPRYFPLLAVLCCYGGGALLAAIQLFPAYDGMLDSYRTDLSERFLSSFSFHPENLLTMVAPDFFGNMDAVPYWGREYMWEESLFVGVSGLFIFFCGLRGKKGMLLAACALFLLILALGAHTPVFGVTSKLPILDKMRGHGKFVFGFMLFFAIVGARGAADLFTRRFSPLIPVLLCGVAFFFAFSAYYVGNAFSLEEWRDMMVFGLKDELFASYAAPHLFEDPAYILRAQSLSAVALYIVAVKLFALSILVFFRERFVWFSYVIVCFALVEMLLFANDYKRTFSVDSFQSPELTHAPSVIAGDARWHDSWLPNRSMTSRLLNVDGYNSRIKSKRYHDYFESFLRPDTWMVNPDGTVTDRYHLSPLLRLTYILAPMNGSLSFLKVTDEPMPRLQLFDEYTVKSDEKELLALLRSPDFDPRKTLILERKPSITPFAGDGSGTVVISEEDTDHMVIEAELPRNQILLVTDAYSRHWRARPLDGSVQEKYEVLPADHILRAIPLAAGKHRFVLEFASSSFVFGVWLSVLCWLLFILFGVGLLLRGRVIRAQ